MSLKLEYAVEINATPDAIWRVFEQIEEWPRWDSEALKSVQWVSGQPWTQGARFEMKLAKPMEFTLRPEILEVAAPVYVRLRGSGSGVTGEQHYIFRWNPDTNVTEARTLQEFSGMPITFMGNRVRQPIMDGIAHMFGKIKQEAESAQPPTVQDIFPQEVGGEVVSSSEQPVEAAHEPILLPESSLMPESVDTQTQAEEPPQSSPVTGVS